MKKTGLVLLAAMAMYSCTKYSEPDNDTGKEITIGVSIDDTTRATLDGVTTKWETGDQLVEIPELQSTEMARYDLTSGEGTKNGIFTGTPVAKGSSSCYFMFYPDLVAYSSSAKETMFKESYVWFRVNSDQCYYPNSLDPNDLKMVGVRRDAQSVSMKPYIAVLRVNVKTTEDFELDKIVVIGKSIAGTYYLLRRELATAIDNNDLYKGASRKALVGNEICYSCTDPVQLNKSEFTQFNVAILPGTTSLEIQFWNAAKDRVAVLRKNTETEFHVGKIKSFGDIVLSVQHKDITVIPDDGTEVDISELTSFNHKIKVNCNTSVPFTKQELIDILSKANSETITQYPYLELDLGNTTYISTNWPSKVIEFKECSAYYDCLSDIVLPKNIRVIDTQAFLPSNYLSSVTLPDGLLTISSVSFYDKMENLNWLTPALPGLTINIPSSVTEIGMAFTNVLEWQVSNDNPKFMTDSQGALYEYTMIGGVKTPKRLIAYPGKTTATEFTIPDSVTRIDNYAFDNTHNLEKIVIGSGISEISNTHIFRFSNKVNTVEFKSTSINRKVVLAEYFGTSATTAKKVFVPESKFLEYRDNGYFADWIAAGWTLTYEGYTPSSASSNADISPVESNNQNL